jgi:predicted phage terminase large subunit-like protein
MNQVFSESVSNKRKVALSSFELDIADIKYQQSVLKAEFSLYEFFKQAWPIIEGKTPFIDSWHIQAISEHLEACFNREIRNLLINVPPRSSKSSLISVAFPAWVWIRNPEEKFMYASYAGSLATEHSLKCKRLIESDWYKKRWGYKFQLAKDQKAKSFYENNKTGYRISTSVGAGSTGKGASFLVADDPNSAQEGASDVKRETANSWWDQVWSTRLNNPKKDVRIVVQQRIHEKDISGHIMANDDAKEWTKLIIPMEFEEKRRARTIVLPTTEGQIWEDPRTTEGQLLAEERFSIKEINRYKQDLGAYGYAGQYQQRPAPEEGGIIKKPWFQWWKDTTPPQIEFILMSWDTALTAKDMSAYSACTTWGIFFDEHYIENLILLSMWRDRLEYPELREITKRLYFDYRDTGKERNPLFKGRPVDMCLIEAKASGDPLIQDLAAAGIRAIPFVPNKYGDKIQRVRLITPLIEGARVWLPAKPPNYDRLLPFADTFLESVATFPNSESRDLVDTMTQALLKLKEGKFLLNPRDEKPITSSYKEVKVY